jgi:pimeloyl-ACP methyl ester carboxylesterase
VPHVSVNGVQLYFEEQGSGTPILGIHGAGSSALFWEDAAHTLAEHGRAIVYDRRGCNRSERPRAYGATTVQEHAADARALLQELDAEPAVLIGRSYGGTVALDVALEHPQSVLGIALLEAGPMGLSPEYDAWFASLRDRSEKVEAEAVGEVVMREVFGAWEELPTAWRDVFTRNGPALLAELRGEERTANERFGELDVPALVVTADASPKVIRDASEALARALPGSRSARVAGDHAIDPAGPHVLAFVRDVLEARARN